MKGKITNQRLRKILAETPEYKLEDLVNKIGLNGIEKDLFLERYVKHIPVYQIAEKHYMTEQNYHYIIRRVLNKVNKSLIDLELDQC